MLILNIELTIQSPNLTRKQSTELLHPFQMEEKI